jgi:hypothetical protein
MENFWCVKHDNIKNESEQNIKRRTKLLNNLMKLNNNRNLDFTDNFYKLLNIDNKCLCKDIFENKYEYSKIGKKIGEGKAGKVYNYKQSDDELIVKEMENINIKDYLSIRVYDYNEDISELNIANYINKFNNKKDNTDKIIAVQGDDFSNQTVLHFIINNILKDNKNYVYLYDAFICNKDGLKKGYNIIEKADGSLIDFIEKNIITDNILVDIIKQILLPLNELKNELYGFNHSDLKTANILYKKEGDKNIFKIADYDKSSIYWNGIRFYNGTLDYRLKNVPFEIKNINNQKFYNLKTFNKLYLQMYTMYSPFGFYLSYDIYTFILSLCMEPKVWQILKTQSGQFYKIFDSLWLNSKNIFRKLHKIHSELENELYSDDFTKYNTILKNMRSLSFINNFLIQGDIDLKYNIDFIYEYFGLLKINKTNIINPQIEISSDKHICTSKCQNQKCNTNKYSKLYKSYTWDYC